MNSTMLSLLLVLALITSGDASDLCCSGDNIFDQYERHCIGQNETTLSALPLNCTGRSFEIEMDVVVDPQDDSIRTGFFFVYTIPSGKYCLTTLKTRYKELKNNSALVCSPMEFSDVELWPRIKVYAACTFLSVILLLATFIVYVLVPDLRTLHDICLMCTVISFCLAYFFDGLLLLHVIGVHTSGHEIAGHITFFWMMAAIVWLNVVCFNIWRMHIFSSFPLSDKVLLVCYFIYGWGLPLTLTIVEAFLGDDVMEWQDYPSIIWNKGSVLIFWLPISLLLALNIIYFASTLCRICCCRGDNQKILNKKDRCCVYCKLFLIMGIPWPLDFVINSFIHYGTGVMNCWILLQGLFIFLVLVIFRKKVMRGLSKRFNCKRCPEYLTTGEDVEELELPQTSV